MEELIIKSKSGDLKAFTQIFLLLKDDLYKIAKTRLICDSDIDDAIQETMIQTYKSIKSLRKPESFKSWIIRILINNCNKIYKKQKKFISYEQHLDNYLDDNRQNLIQTDIDFYLLMKFLNDDERTAITLYYLENYNIKEISKILKTNENTIKTRLSRAKKKIKNNYKGDEYIGLHR